MRRRTRPGQARTWLDKGRAAFFIALIHVAPVVAVARGTAATDWVAFAILYPTFALSATVVLHRYFAHSAFATSRLLQGVMGVVATTMFVDPIRFVGKHRLHHRFSDTARDVHSPGDGFWFCWFGSLVDEGYSDAEIVAAARDLTRYRELRWLHAHFIVPGLALWGVLLAVGGFSTFAIGYCLSLALVQNQASLVNYCCHRWGYRRFETKDRSTNNPAVALLTLGEGWHNNHHRFPRSARAGMGGWEVDPLFGVIRLLAAFGLVWNVIVADPHARRRTTGGPPPSIS